MAAAMSATWPTGGIAIINGKQRRLSPTARVTYRGKAKIRDHGEDREDGSEADEEGSAAHLLLAARICQE